MTWTFANAVVQRDGKDNIQPIKKRSRGRIDPVVATCSAISVWKREPEAIASVYLSRGVRRLGESSHA
jgi:phage terminase large subunit-like protein